MITCPACSKQNQDHYRFCLGCGAELPRGGTPAAAGEEAADEETKVGGSVSEPPSAGTAPPPGPPMPAEEFDSEEPAAAALDDEPEGALMPPGKCPECEYVNPSTNRFAQRIDEYRLVCIRLFV